MTTLDDHVLWSLHTEYDERYTRRMANDNYSSITSGFLRELDKLQFGWDSLDNLITIEQLRHDRDHSHRLSVGRDGQVSESALPHRTSRDISLHTGAAFSTIPNEYGISSEMPSESAVQCGPVLVPPKMPAHHIQGGGVTYAPRSIAIALIEQRVASLKSEHLNQLASELPDGCEPIAALYSSAVDNFNRAKSLLGGLRSGATALREAQTAAALEGLRAGADASTLATQRVESSSSSHADGAAALSNDTLGFITNRWIDVASRLPSSWFNPAATRVYPPGTQLLEQDQTLNVVDSQQSEWQQQLPADQVDFYTNARALYSDLCMQALVAEVARRREELAQNGEDVGTDEEIMPPSEQNVYMQSVAETLWEKALNDTRVQVEGHVDI